MRYQRTKIYITLNELNNNLIPEHPSIRVMFTFNLIKFAAKPQQGYTLHMLR